MSVRAMAWAWEQDIPPSTKAVLLALADHADNDGICWPGVKAVAQKCRLSPSAIRYHMRALRRRGLVLSIVREREDGSQTSNSYHLPVNILTPPYQDVDTPPANHAYPPLQDVDTHEPPLEPSLREEKIPPLVPPFHRVEGGTPPTRKGKQQPIPMNGDERQKLYEVFASTWTVEEINQRVEEALNHVAASRVKSQYLYVRGWLRRDRERLSVGGRAPLKVGRDGKPFTSFDNSLEKFIDLQKHDTQIGREESDATARDRIAADKIQHMDRPA